MTYDQSNPDAHAHTENPYNDYEQHISEGSHDFSTLVQNFIGAMKTPATDIEKNIKALLSETISTMDLVSRDELERQTALLATAQKKLSLLEQKLNELEKK